MFLQASFDARGSVESIAVEKRSHDGKTLMATSFPATATMAQRIKACKCLNIPVALVNLIDVSAKRKTQRLNLTNEYSALSETYYVRNQLEKGSEREEFDTFEAALKDAGVANPRKILDSVPLIEWSKVENTCCLDLDFEEQDKPELHRLRAAVSEMEFAPRWLLTTKSGSVHLIYEADEVITALEFAACGMIELQRCFPQTKFEFLNSTRTSFAEPKQYTQTKTLNKLLPMMYEREAATGDFVAWLAERGLKPGGRYPHSECPISPDNRAKGNDPVQVHKHGIKCHKCESEGIKRGSKDAGWFPARVLMGGLARPNDLLTSARNFVHYDHVQCELEKFNVPEHAQRGIYGALLKGLHGVDDARIEMVWSPGGRKKLLRKSGYWVDENNDTVETTRNATLIEELPFVWNVGHDGSLVLDRVRLAWAKDGCSLSPYGFHEFRSVSGYQFSRFDDEQTRILRVTPDYLWGKEKYQPRYIGEQGRLEFEECKARVLAMFPGIHWEYLMLLLIGRGCAEYTHGRMSMVAVTGPTGAGKSLHCQIAAAFTGDLPQPYSDQQTAQGFYEAIHANGKNSLYFLADELFKNYVNGSTQVITNLLQMTPQTGFHLLYVGNVKLGVSPLVVVTETTIPLAIRQNEQLGRRFIHVQLNSAWKIEDRLNELGLTDVLRMRLAFSDEQLEAVNGLLSWLTDMYFLSGRPDFFQLAEVLGFKPLREGEAVEDRNKLIRELVLAIRRADKVKFGTAEQKRFGSGYSLTRFGSNEELWQAFAALQTDADRRKGELECNALDECDLKAVCDLKNSNRIAVKRHGRFVAFKLQEV